MTWGLAHLHDSNPCSCNAENANLLIVAADSCITKPPLSDLFRKSCFYPFEKKVLSAYFNLHDRVNRRKVIDSAETVSLDGFLTFKLENTATHMS